MRETKVTSPPVRGAVLVVLFSLASALGWATTRGPDAAGYIATDATVYSFVDISTASGGASIMAGADDATAALTLPFTFQLYDGSYTLLCVSTNGALYFVTSSGACSAIVDFANTDLTTSSPPGDLPALFPFWSDLSFQVPGAGAVFYRTIGAPGARRFIVQWDNAYPQGSPNPVTFQVVLAEGSNRILFQYRNVDLGSGNPGNRGADATIGIRNAGALVSAQQVQWSFGVPVIPDESALLFSRGVASAPTLTWPAPADIVYGTALGPTQLNATADVPGAFAYTPPAGTVLPVGNGQTLSTTFTPFDTVRYLTATASVVINVLPAPTLTVTVLAPNGGEKVFVGVPTVVRWSATGAPTSIDVELSHHGQSGMFAPIPGCTRLSGSASSCNWTPGRSANPRAIVRVTAHAAGTSASDTSDAAFVISPATPVIRVTAPRGRVTVGSSEMIRWHHNLGRHSLVRVELSRNGGGAWETLASSVENTMRDSGSFRWVVTGPTTPNARIRVSALDVPISDTSAPFSVAARDHDDDDRRRHAAERRER